MSFGTEFNKDKLSVMFGEQVIIVQTDAKYFFRRNQRIKPLNASLVVLTSSSLITVKIFIDAKCMLVSFSASNIALSLQPPVGHLVKQLDIMVALSFHLKCFLALKSTTATDNINYL